MTRPFLIATLCVATVVVHLPGQDTQTEPHDDRFLVLTVSGGIAGARTAIDARRDSGLVPVGFELASDGSLLVLLIRDLPEPVTGWEIAEYANWNTLESDITSAIRSGYRPADISKRGDSLFVLWLQSDAAISGWRIHAAAENRDAHADTIAHFARSGFLLRGLSSSDGLDWFLFVSRETEGASASIEHFDADPIALREGISAAIEHGLTPRGIGSDAHGFVVIFSDKLPEPSLFDYWPRRH